MIPQLSQLQQSLHRACCCGCLPTIELTLAGFDGNHCGCNVSGITSKRYTGSAGIDGTYSVDLDSYNDTRCVYILQFTDLGTTTDYDLHGAFDTTCATPTSSGTETEIQITVDVWRQTLGVRTISVQTRKPGGTSSESSNLFEVSVSASPGYSIGAAINNQDVCTPTNNPGTGYAHSFYNSHGGVGTAQVDIP